MTQAQAALLWFTFRTAVFGLVLATLVLAVQWRRTRVAVVPAGVRAAAATAAGIGLVVAAGVAFSGVAGLFGVSLPFSRTVLTWSYLVPLAVGVVGVAVLLLPWRGGPLVGQRGSGALVARRTVLSFVSRGWAVAAGVAGLLAVALAMAAGALSSPDDGGRYTMYWADVGPAAAGGDIYGWYYSLPCLAVLLVLYLLAAVALRRIAAPPAGVEPEVDAAVRRWRSRAVLVAVTAACCLHLAGVLGGLSDTASIRGYVGTEQGAFRVWAGFAELAVPLRWAGRVAATLGWALWFGLLGRAAIGPRRAR